MAAESFPLPSGGYSTAPVAWYLLRIAPGAAKAATLTKLSIPGQPTGTQVSGIALSPNGSELAVLFQRGVWVIGGRTGPLTLSVYSVSTGKALRTWTQQTNDRPAGYGWYWGRYSNSSITWLSDGSTLAFADGTLDGDNGPPLGGAFSDVKIRAINLAGPSGDLIADSKVVFSSENNWCSTLQLTPDGKTVFCGLYVSNGDRSSSANDPEILAYSVATGKSRLAYRLKGAFTDGMANVLWLSPDGSTLIGAVFGLGGESRPGVIGDEQAVGLITKGTLKPIGRPQSGVPLTGEIAF